jgi:NAD(P)-dependent dehydrogenase (short-subunit alcohol dehydrogenase family)
MTCCQVALVTGGSRGIDAASPVRLAANGAIVVTSADRPHRRALRCDMFDGYGLAPIGCDAGGMNNQPREHLLGAEAE